MRVVECNMLPPGRLRVAAHIHFPPLCIPDLVRFTWDKIKTLQMRLELSDVPDSRGLSNLIGKLVGDVKLEQAIHAAKCVNRVQPATD